MNDSLHSSPDYDDTAHESQLSLPYTVNIAYWNGEGDLYDVHLEGSDPGYAILHATNGQWPGWYALRASSAVEAYKALLRPQDRMIILGRSDQWLRGFTFLRDFDQRCCSDLSTALAQIREDQQGMGRREV